MCISKGISCRSIRQMQRTYTKVLHEIHPNVTTVFNSFPCFVLFSKCLSISFLQIRHVWIPLSTPTNLFDCDFYWWPRAKQTTNSNMIWYLNMNKSTYGHWSKHVGENLPSAMHFIIFVTFRSFFAEIARLCLFIIDTFLFCKWSIRIIQ